MFFAAPPRGEKRTAVMAKPKTVTKKRRIKAIPLLLLIVIIIMIAHLSWNIAEFFSRKGTLTLF